MKKPVPIAVLKPSASGTTWRLLALLLLCLASLLAHHLAADDPLPVRTAAWHTKTEAPFSDVIAFVRGYPWAHTKFVNPHAQGKLIPISGAMLHGLVDTQCYVA